MILLTATLCASIAMDDCKAHELGKFDTQWQCHEVELIHAAYLSRGPDEYYLLACKSDGKA